MLRPTIYIPSRLTKLLTPNAWNQGQVSGAEDSAVITTAQQATSWWSPAACVGFCPC
jgi:hypothetical protein